MDVTQLALTWVGWPNGVQFDLDQSERKSSQVNVSAPKPWPNEVASWPKSSTCVNLRLRLPGQTDSQVIASSGKLNLSKDLRWVAKLTGKFPHKCMQVAKKKHFKVDFSCISLANNNLMNVTQLALTWVGWPKGEKLASTCVQIWSRPKWAQVIASQRKCTWGLAKRSRK